MNNLPVQPSDFEVSVRGIGRELFDAAIKVALYDRIVVGWREEKEKGSLVLCWGGLLDGKCTPLIVPLKAEEVAQIAWIWLERQEPNALSKPDVDGSVSKGFLISSDQKDGWDYVLARIWPVWVTYHK